MAESGSGVEQAQAETYRHSVLGYQRTVDLLPLLMNGLMYTWQSLAITSEGHHSVAASVNEL